jgi:endoglucanase
MQNVVPIFIVYNAIQRDLGGESAGGALTLADYFHWIESFVRKTKRIEMIVILEPDALPHLPEMRVAEQALRVRMIAGALERLRQHKKASVYMDIGHPHWLSVDTAARMLQQFKSTQFDGFALNVANRQPTQDCLAYGVAVSQKVGGKHFVIDTSRNAIPHEDWCNPSPEGCGEKPTFTTGHALCDAYLWLKSPGESDGTCNSGPPAGVLWLERAVQVASNAK